MRMLYQTNGRTEPHLEYISTGNKRCVSFRPIDYVWRHPTANHVSNWETSATPLIVHWLGLAFDGRSKDVTKFADLLAEERSESARVVVL